MTTLTLIGDLQRTLFIERICGREQNDLERAFLLNQAAQKQTDAYWFLGDLVDVGGLTLSWKKFDQVAAPILKQNQTKNALYGNHDYWGFRKPVNLAMRERFINLAEKNYGEIRYADLTVLYLDSNRPMMSAAQWANQQQWFAAALERLDTDSTVHHVVVFSHHPPFTNSKRYAGKKSFQKNWVPSFNRAKKTRAWISGHVHSYEKFSLAQKTFLVMGSSGGPRAPLYTGQRQRLPDQFRGPGLRPFIFATLEANPDTLQISVQGFEKTELKLRLIDEIKTHA